MKTALMLIVVVAAWLLVSELEYRREFEQQPSASHQGDFGFTPQDEPR